MRLKLCLLLVFIINFSWAQSGSTKTFTGNGTFPVPAGVTSVQVQAWGGGGSGGGASGAPLLLGRGAAGGGGGAYASNTLLVTPGATLNVVVASQTSGTTGAGAAGGNSTITGFESSILAAGGSGGDANNAGGSPVGGAGGTTAASAGNIKFAGANGGNGNSWNLLGLLLSSGAGGNGGGSGGAGGTAVSGLLLSNGPGNAGSPPGGAGSGAINSALGAAQIGGAGAAGRVVISYSCATFSLTSTAAANVCAAAGSTSAVTLTGSAASLPVGNYVVTYNRSSPSGTALTANLTVTTAGTGTFTAVGLTTAGSSTITITNLTSETCSSNITTNNTATVIVSPASVGGTVTGGTTINAGSTSGLLTLSGHTGSIVKWQSSVSPFTTWTDIANTTTTYTSGVLNETTQFRAVVQSGSCAVANSAATTVTVNPRPTITLTSPVISGCSTGSASQIALNYSATTENPTTYSIVWSPSPANSFVAVTDAALPANSIPIAIPAGATPATYTGTLTVKNANGAVSSPGTSFTVTINETPSISSSGTATSICSSNSLQNASLAYSAVTGNPTSYSVNWSPPALSAGLLNQASTPFSFVSGGGIVNTIQVPANTAAGTHIGEIIISNGNCTFTQPLFLTIIPATVGGTVNGGSTIEYGNTSGLLTLSGYTGLVLKWQSSVSPFTTWVDIAYTSNPYTSGPLTETTQFRAVVRSGTCAVENSAPATVTVNPRPTITLLSSTVSHCSTNDGSSLTVFLPYTAITENPITYSIVWDSSLPSTFVPVTDAVLPANQIQVDLPAGLVSGNFSGTLTVKNANGAVSSPGTSFTVTVNETPLITTTGEIDSVCTSANAQTATLTYSGVSGNPINYSINWSEDANAALLVDQPATSFAFSPSGGDIDTIQIPANVPAGTYYGSMNIFNGICNQSQNVTITIDSLPVGGAVTGGTTIGSGSTSGLLTLSGHTGSVVKWQSAVSPFTTWVDIVLTDGITTYTSNPLTETTQFRAVLRSGNCDYAYSEPTTVTVEDLPTITLAAATENRCYGDNSNNVKLGYTGTTGDPVTYSIVWNSSPANTLAPVTDAALPASPIVITVPTGTSLAEGTYTGTLTVKDANGIESAGSTFTLTVGGLAFVLTDGDINPIITSSSQQNALLPYSGTSINNPQYLPTKYYIDWDQAANTALLTDQSTTAFAFSSSGGVVNTIVIPANVPAGTYSGVMYISNETSCNQSQSVSIVINPLVVPTITLDSSELTLCSDGGSSDNEDLDYSETTGDPITYSIVWNSSPGSTLVNVTDQLLPPYITFNVPADTAFGTYTGILTVKNANGAVSPDVTFTLTKTQSVEFTTTGIFNSICSSNSSQMATLEYSGLTGNPTAYSISWGGVSGLPNQEHIPFVFAPGGGILTIEIPGGFSGNNQGQLYIENGTDCYWSGPISLVIKKTPTITIASTATQVCTSSNSQLVSVDYSNLTGSLTKYSIDWPDESIPDQGDTAFAFTPGSGTINTIVVPANTPPGVYGGQLILKNDAGCSVTKFVTIQINQAPATPVVSVITPQTDQSPGSVSFTGLPASGTWELLMNPGSVVYTGAGSTRTISNLEAGTYTFSVISRRTSSCYSEPITVEIPYEESAPSIELLTTVIHTCTNLDSEHFVELPYAEASGSPITYSIVWEEQEFINNPEEVIDAPLPASPIIINLPSVSQVTYHGTLTVKNANGIVSSGSTFDIVGHNSSSVNTTTNGFGTCAGSETASLYYFGYSGNPISYSVDWDDTANAAFLADVPVTPYSFDPNGGYIEVPVSPNALGGVYYGTIIIYDEYCSASRTLQMSIEESVGGTVTGGTTISSGSTSDLLTLSGEHGYIVKWQSAVSPFTTWTDIENQENTYTSEPLTETTQFRAVVKTGSCVAANSEPTTVTVIDLPSIHLVSTLVKRCTDFNNYPHNVDLPYNQATGNPVTYSIVWNSSPTNNFVAVTDAALPASPISVLVPYNAPTGTYTGTLTVKNANGDVSSPLTFYVETAFTGGSIVTTGTIAPVSTAATSQTTTLPYSSSANNPDKYYIDWNPAANAAGLADQPNTLFAFNASGGTIDSINIPANVPAGTYNGTLFAGFADCYRPNAVTITINAVIAQPTITLTTGTGDVCSDGNSSQVGGRLYYSSTTGSPVTYSIVWDPSPTNSILPVTDAALPVDYITLRIPRTSNDGTYTGTLTVKNANGDVSSPVAFTANYGRYANFTSNGIVAPVSASTSSQTTTLNYTAIFNEPVRYVIDWNAAANAASLADQASTPFTFSSSGGTIDGIVIPANVPAGTYTGVLYSNSTFCQGSGRTITLVINSSGARGTIDSRPEIVETSKSAKNHILITAENKVINVETKEHKIDKVYVFDVSGNLIYKKEGVQDPKLIINDVRSSNQVLIIRAVLDNGQTETAKIIY